MFTFLLIVQTLVAASLVLVILMQRSEGGGQDGADGETTDSTHPSDATA